MRYGWIDEMDGGSGVVSVDVDGLVGARGESNGTKSNGREGD